MKVMKWHGQWAVVSKTIFGELNIHAVFNSKSEAAAEVKRITL